MKMVKKITPYKCQNEALKLLEKAEKTTNKGVVVMPTGTGKTFLAALWFKKKLEKNKNSRLLFICHNKDILAQANEKEFQICLEKFKIKYGHYGGKKKNIQQVTFATTQTLTRHLNEFKIGQFDYVIVDEAHHYQARSFKKVVTFFQPKFSLGLTATPNRLDKKDIFKICGDKVYELTVYDAIHKYRLLSKPKYYATKNNIDFSKIKWNGHQYDEKDINRKICIKEYDDAIIKEYKKDVKRFETTKTICFCATVEHAYRMGKKFNEAGIKAVTLTAKYKKEKTEISLSDYKRNKIITDFRQGKYKIIFVRDMFNEGIDIPDADCVMMLRPTLSNTIFTQQIGRGLRTSPNKRFLLILDFVGNSKRCWLNYEAMTNMMGTDLVKKIKNHDISKKKKGEEIRFVSNGCEVILNKESIDILQSKEITKQDLIDNYQEFEKKLGRQPTYKDFCKNKGSKYTRNQYIKMFGTWTDFLKEIGIKGYDYSKYITKQDLINNYWKFKKKLRRQPECKDMLKDKGSKYSLNQYINLFGSWTGFLKEIREPLFKNYDYYVTKQDLIDNYQELKKKLGRQPTCLDLVKKRGSKYDYQWYDKLFGSRNAFLKEIGETKIITKQDLIDNYQELKNKLGRRPWYNDMNKNKGSKYSVWHYMKLFGSWSGFLKKTGNESKTITKQDLIDNYQELKKKLGRQPTYKDFCKNKESRYGYRKYIELFGRNTAFLKEIGELKTITKQDLIDNYWELEKKLKRKPMCTDMIKNKGRSKYGYTLYMKLFGSWTGFLKEIGESKKIIAKQDLINNYWEFKNKLGRQPAQKDMQKNKGSKYNVDSYKKFFGYWSGFLKEIGEPKNPYFKNCVFVKPVIVSDYVPVNELVSQPIKKVINDKKKQSQNDLSGYRFHSSTEKNNIRDKIISKIKDGDVVLLLESAELAAIKEIEKQGKKPSKIIIPNNKEFDEVAKELKKYKTVLNIELVNTSALQYLNDTDLHFDFVWLDYYGAFTAYKRDLDLVLLKQQEYVLVLTYNIYDPMKQDDLHYFTKVIAYVQRNTNHGQKANLIEDISYKYKKTMYTVGFNITKMEA